MQTYLVSNRMNDNDKKTEANPNKVRDDLISSLSEDLMQLHVHGKLFKDATQEVSEEQHNKTVQTIQGLDAEIRHEIFKAAAKKIQKYVTDNLGDYDINAENLDQIEFSAARNITRAAYEYQHAHQGRGAEGSKRAHELLRHPAMAQATRELFRYGEILNPRTFSR